MKGGDFTRSTFDKARHFTKVNKQQGRAEVDADSREQNDIVSHHEQTFLRDIVGKTGTLKVKLDNGFEISGFEISENFSFKWDVHHPDSIEGKLLRTFLRDNFGLLWIAEESPVIHNDGNTLTLTAPDGLHSVTITRGAAGRNPVLAIDNKPAYEFLQSGDDVSSRGYIIHKGEYYVDGILCENESDVEASRQPDILAEQQVRFLIFEWPESAVADPVKAAIAGFVSGMFPAMASEKLDVEKTSETLIKVTNPLTSAAAEIELRENEGTALLKPPVTFDTDVVTLAAKKSAGKILLYYQVENQSLASSHPQDNGASYIAYLDTWDQHVTHLEAPHIREKALGGVDTATRTRTAWQVKLLRFHAQTANKCTIMEDFQQLGNRLLGRMQARPKPTVEPTDMCKLYETAGYQGLENHLYRVEVHKGGNFSESTFKWSRDNGVVVSAVTKIHDLENKIEIQSRGRDDNLDFKHDTWIEITDNLHEQFGLPGTMVKVKDVKENTIIYDSDKVIGLPITEANFSQSPKARRWDSDGVLKPQNTTDYIELENGVEIRLGEGDYLTGAYWWVVARANSEESIEWPRVGNKLTDEPQALLPAGEEHHYAPLAVLQYLDGKYTVRFDARSFFSSLTDLILIHYAGGDGQEAPPGNNKLAEPLRVAVTIGGTSIGVQGAIVRFTVTKPPTSFPPPPGSGFLSPINSPLEASSLEILTNEEGIAECLWTLADGSVEQQQVKAELVDCGDVKLPPIYFGATLSGPDRGMSANTGELNLIIPKTAQRRRLPLVYGPFEHHVDHLPPPALLLGLVTLEGNGKIKYTEDYDTNMSVNANGASIPDIALHFKPVEITEKEFNVHLWVCLDGSCEPPPTDIPSTIELDSDWLESEMKDGFEFSNQINPKFYRLDTDTRVMLRWWAIPAEEQPPVPDTLPHESQ